MKKLLPLILILGFIIPIQPANAVFGLGDCKNLAKRINAGQKEYEKAWDKYQTARENSSSRNMIDTQAVTRLKFTASISSKMFADMAKYPKCLSVTTVFLNKYWGIVKMLNNYVDWSSIYYDPLSVPLDHKYFLK